MHETPGEKLGPYILEALIGAGGMGEVYRARDSRLHRLVAIKICREEFSARFEREAQTVAALNHPNICTLHDIGPNYLVMELVEGKTLAERIAQRTLMPIDAVRIARQITEALEAAHGKGIIHRDLKPANIKVAPSGVVKVLDFGLAKITEGLAVTADAPTVTRQPATLDGVLLGTVPYMSPEQAEGLPVDHRTDLWSLGIVLYEMLAQRPPFDGSTAQRIILNILQRPTPSLPGVPPELQRIVDRCLQKDRPSRYPSAESLGRDLDACAAALTATDGPLDVRTLISLARRRIGIPAALFLVGMIATGGWWVHRSSVRRWAKQEAIPQALVLADKGDYAAAYQLAIEAERYLPGDPALRDLWPDVSRVLSVHSDPSGAELTWTPYGQLNGSWQSLGSTPVLKRRLPAGPIRLRVARAGYAPIEVAAPSSEYRFKLVPQGTLPADMVRVPAGPFRAQFGGIGDLSASLEEFDIDRHEVTNLQFKEFADRGGYRTRAYWTVPFVENGRELSWEVAMARFVDATGRTGPAAWDAGSYPEGQENYPVTGVSWYEAAAYAAFVGGSLPTVYHWWRAANTDDSRFLIALSNFAGSGPLPVGRSGALGTYGTIDMAGNVREWTWNETSGQRYILGGSWADPSYMLMRGQLATPFDRGRTNGFRCARYLSGARAPEALAAPIAPRPIPAYLTATPVDDEAFELYKGLYAYERSDLGARVESVDDSSDLWRRETVRFKAAYGNEEVIAYLFVPRRGRPPYACVIDVPSSTALRPGSGESIRPESYVLRSGRAMLYPIFKGTYERYGGVPSYEPVAIRDAVITWSKDLGRAIDYLETRTDVDGAKLAYMGHSLGSQIAPLVLSMERRLAVAVLLSGGLTPYFGKLPEANVINFLPRVKTPVLMVNGKYDSIMPVSVAQEPMFQRLATPAADKRHVTLDTGHAVTLPEVRNDLIREVLDWLDRYLGRAG